VPDSRTDNAIAIATIAQIEAMIDVKRAWAIAIPPKSVTGVLAAQDLLKDPILAAPAWTS